jgi:metal-sulfur cluster biosynthetic enzyme
MKSQAKKLTRKEVFKQLNTVLDPELRIGLVDLGLIYDVSLSSKQTARGERTQIHILMTLTSPGCPLASVFDQMVKSGLSSLPGIDAQQDITVEITFDPPWIIDMMNPEVRARLEL